MIAKRRRQKVLHVFLNNRLVGYWVKAPSGAMSFEYESSWLDWEYALPVSLSLPLREDPYRGEPVAAVFENLLPDDEQLRRRVAQAVGAGGIDAYHLLAAIGRDCVGALQFVGDQNGKRGYGPKDTTKIKGRTMQEEEIENLLNGLTQVPLGIEQDDPFRISVAGAQEKTALLWHQGCWLKPYGTTPTTHLLKTQIGQLPNGIDLSSSIENEFYCLKLAELCGLPVNQAEIQTFGQTKALVIERFDRKWTKDRRFLRLPQEDCCQALSVPPTRKYQNEGGPGLIQVLELLKGSDKPIDDQHTVFKAQMFFWLIGATDGHAKNFSIFLGPGGSYQLTPLYDVLSAQPSLQNNEIQPKQMKLAMSVGNNRHYKLDEIFARHFIQTGQKAGLPKHFMQSWIAEMSELMVHALEHVEEQLPKDFPEIIHNTVKRGVEERLTRLKEA